MPTSVRLDAKTEAAVRRLARRTGRSKSQVIREAILRLSDASSQPMDGGTVYEQIADLVGIVRSGRRNIAARSEDVLRELFARRSGKR